MRRAFVFAAASLAICLSPLAASAGPQTSEVQFDFSESGQTTAFSAVYTPGTDISFTEVYGGYTLLISAASDSAYGQTDAGADPFLSYTIQVSPVGRKPPPPITIGMSLTGLTSSPGDTYGLDSTGTAIFHTNSNAVFRTFDDASDALFGTGNPLSTFLLNKVGNAQDQTLFEEIGSAYSLSMFFTLNPVANAHPTLDGQLEVNAMPEPSTLGLLGVACLGLGAGVRRKRALRRD